MGITAEPNKPWEKNSGSFDFGIFGEGEITFSELVDSLDNKNSTADIAGIKGLAYRTDNGVVFNQEREFIKDLDSLPFPNYQIFDSFSQIQAYPLMTSRGCPFKCIFCLNSQLSRRQWRSRSPKNVIDELKYAKEPYRIERFEIWDDNFAMDIDRAISICNLLIKEGLELEYSLPNGIRAASITPELAEMLKKSGCTMVNIGVEDGNPETFSYVNKGESLEDIERGIKLLQKVNLPVCVSMIIGLPYTTYQSTLKSMDFIKRMDVRANWYLPIPFPHTSLYQWACQDGRFYQSLDEMGDLNFNKVIFDTPEFTKDERYKAFYLANMEYSFPEKTPKLIPFEPLYYLGQNSFERIFNSFVIVWKYNRKRIFKHSYIITKRLTKAFAWRSNYILILIKNMVIKLIGHKGVRV